MSNEKANGLGPEIRVEAPADGLIERIRNRSTTVAIIGLGYVGLPLAVASGRAGFQTFGFDTDPEKPKFLSSGRSYIDGVDDHEIRRLAAQGRFSATTDFTELAGCDIVAICVPTPLTRQRTPDLSFVESTSATIAQHARPGQLIVLESTTYPGTTRQVVKPILERHGRRSGVDFFLGFSPEREDPGNREFRTATIPKITAGDGPEAARATEAFYHTIVSQVVSVSSLEVAEATKLTENVFRAVNIALVNELKTIFDRMGIDVWEVIDAAKTKPFGYMPFYPGPGLGGHCIPIDPFYLAWKSREYGLTTRFIELAGEINLSMSYYVIGKLEEALDLRAAKSLGASRVLIVGVAYKKNVADIRESPSFKLIELLEKRGTKTDFYDPYVHEIGKTREHLPLRGRKSVQLDARVIASYDAIVIATDHDCIDYGLLADYAKLIVDTRNICARLGLASDNVVKA